MTGPPHPWRRRAGETIRRVTLLLLVVLLFSIPLVFTAKTFDQFELPQQCLLRTVVGLAVPLCAARVLVESRWRWRRTPLDVPIAIWTAWLLFKTFDSVAPAVSWRGEYEGLDGTLTRLHYAALYFLATQTLRRTREAWHLLLAFLGGSVCAGSYVTLQAAGVDFFAWGVSFEGFGRYSGSLGSPLAVAAVMIMALPVALVLPVSRVALSRRRDLATFGVVLVGGVSIWWIFVLVLGRVRTPGTISGPADLAGVDPWILVGATAAFAFQILFAVRGRPVAGRVSVCAGCALILLWSIHRSGSRGALLGLACAGVLGAVLGPRVRRMRDPSPSRDRPRRAASRWLGISAAAAGVAVLLGLALAFPRARESALHPLAALQESRLHVWESAVSLWWERPFVGWGVDSFKQVFPAHETVDFAKYHDPNAVPQNAHSEPLQILATVGSLGLVLWTVLLGTWMVASIRCVMRRHGREHRLLHVVTLASTAALLAQNLVGFGVAAAWTFFWIALAVPWAQPGEPVVREPVAGGFLRFCAVAVGLASLGLGLPSAVTALAADAHHLKGVQLQEMLTSVTGRSVAELRGAVARTVASSESASRVLEPAVRDEVTALADACRRLDGELQHGMWAGEDTRRRYEALAARLLAIVAHAEQARAARLAPLEPRYAWYAGLAAEEAYRWAPSDPLRAAWFARADEADRGAAGLSPRNAYIHASLGRLWARRFGRGRADALDVAVGHYRRAIACAPLRAGAYRELMDLLLLAGSKQAVVQVAIDAAPRSIELAADLLVGASELLGRRAEAETASGDHASAVESRNLARDALERARRLARADGPGSAAKPGP